MPSLLQHATLPPFGKGKGFTTARAAFRDKDFALDKEAEFPLAWPGHESAAGPTPPTAHRPQRADVARCIQS